MKSPISEYLLDQKYEGEFQDSGEFQLDLVKALSKLEAFRMANRSDYLLKILQAAVALGASRFDVRVGIRYLQISFEAKAEHLDGLDQMALGVLGRASFSNRGLKHLAVGLQSSLASARSVALEVNDKLVLCLGSGNSKVGDVPTMDYTALMRVQIRRSGHFLALIAQRFSDQWPKDERIKFCPIPVVIDSVELRRGWSDYDPHALQWGNGFFIAEAYLGSFPNLPNFTLPASSPQRFTSLPTGWSRWNRADWDKPLPWPTFLRFSASPVSDGRLTCKVALTVSSELSQQAKLIFVVDGVSTEPKTQNWNFPGLTVVLSGAEMQLDLTELQVVEDSVYDQRIRALDPVLQVVAERLQDNLDELREFLAYKSGPSNTVIRTAAIGKLPRPNKLSVLPPQNLPDPDRLNEPPTPLS